MSHWAFCVISSSTLFALQGRGTLLACQHTVREINIDDMGVWSSVKISLYSHILLFQQSLTAM